MEPVLITLVIPCFNNGREALSAVISIGRLLRPNGIGLEAIVVDDASTDDSFHLLEGTLPSWASVTRLPRNLGRAGAINLGASLAKGQLLLLLDADCLPETPEFLLSHVASLAGGADASVGDIIGCGTTFWGRYQSDVGRRRALAAAGGSIHALTTANMMLSAATFGAIGGFDTRYRHYGFEDRDFLLRLHYAGFSLKHAPDAAATHIADVDMPGICRKLRQCGSKNASLFRAQYPSAYRELGYAAIDATLHPVLAWLLQPLASIALSHAGRIENWLQQDRWPYRCRVAMARCVTAAAYLEGTRDAARSGDEPLPLRDSMVERKTRE